MPWRQNRVDADFVFTIRQTFQQLMADTEAPGFVIIGRAVGNEVRLFGQRKKMRLQVSQYHLLVDRDAIAYQMQIRALKVDHLFALCIFYKRIANIPLLGHRPVENLCPCRHFVQGQWNLLLQTAQRGTNTITGDAATDRIELGHQAVHGITYGLGIKHG